MQLQLKPYISQFYTHLTIFLNKFFINKQGELALCDIGKVAFRYRKIEASLPGNSSKQTSVIFQEPWPSLKLMP